jgi:AraC-like DNA-binding protein
MSLIAVASRDSALHRRVREALDRRWHDLLPAASWAAALRQIKERPVGLLLLDLPILPPEGPGSVATLRRAFPSLPVLVLARPGSARMLFELGRWRVGQLGLAELASPSGALQRSITASLDRSAPGHVARALSPLFAPRDLAVVRGALETTHRCWSADRLSRSFGFSRPALSEHLKRVGLPSVGHLMVWARLLHAGHWLPDPGRSGESVSRQLEYANGAVFRRALRNYVGVTPTVLAEDGFRRVLEAFALRHAAPLVEVRVQVA